MFVNKESIKQCNITYGRAQGTEWGEGHMAQTTQGVRLWCSNLAWVDPV